MVNFTYINETLKTLEKNAMFNSNHRILSLVHSHIAVLRIAMFFLSVSFFFYTLSECLLKPIL